MKGISVAMQIECECGELVTNDHNNSMGMDKLPMLKSYTIPCKCGIKFFVHIQEQKL